MSKTVKSMVLVTSLVGASVGAYAWSWWRLADTRGLYEFAAADVVAGGLEAPFLRPAVAIEGFGEGREAQVLRASLAKALTSRGRAVSQSDLDARDSADEAMDKLAATQRVTVVSASVVRLKPLDTAVRVRWTNGDHAEIREFGFWWAGTSWMRRPAKDQRLITVSVYQASDITARSIGRTGVSRRLRGKRRAGRRAAGRDRWMSGKGVLKTMLHTILMKPRAQNGRAQ